MERTETLHDHNITLEIVHSAMTGYILTLEKTVFREVDPAKLASEVLEFVQNLETIVNTVPSLRSEFASKK